MPTVSVFIPTMLRAATGGVARVELPARTVREVVDGLEARFAGLADLLLDDEHAALRPGLAVSINSEMATLGLLEPVPEGAEVHFLPAIGGG